MAKKRASVQKRMREQNKRQREFLKTEKANRKRERRLNGEPETPLDETQAPENPIEPSAGGGEAI